MCCGGWTKARNLSPISDHQMFSSANRVRTYQRSRGYVNASDRCARSAAPRSSALGVRVAANDAVEHRHVGVGQSCRDLGEVAEDESGGTWLVPRSDLALYNLQIGGRRLHYHYAGHTGIGKSRADDPNTSTDI
jgi:hypothetical protein